MFAREITEEKAKEVKFDYQPKKILDFQNEPWFLKLKTFCLERDSTYWRDSIIYSYSGICSKLNFKGKSNYDKAHKDHKYVPQSFRQHQVYTKVYTDRPDPTDQTYVVIKVKHEPPLFNNGIILHYLDEEFDTPYLVDKIGVNKGNVEIIGEYCTTLQARASLANNMLYNVKTGMKGNKQFPLPSASQIFCQDKNYSPWLKGSASNVNVPPFVACANGTDYVEEEYRKPKEKLPNGDMPKNYTDDLVRIWEVRWPGITALMRNPDFRRKSREEKYKDMEKLCATSGRWPVWSLSPCYPPWLDPVAEPDVLFDYEDQIRILAYSGAIILDLSLAYKMFGENFQNQSQAMSNLQEGQGPKDLGLNEAIRYVPVVPQEEEGSGVYGQRVGGLRYGLPPTTPTNLEAIRRLLNASGGLEKSEYDKLLTKTNVVFPLMKLVRGQDKLTHTQLTTVQLDVTGKYYLSMTQEEMRSKKTGGAERKRKAIEKNNENIEKIKRKKADPLFQWTLTTVQSQDPTTRAPIVMKYKTFINNLFDQLRLGLGDAYLKSPRVIPFADKFIEAFDEPTRNPNHTRLMEFLGGSEDLAKEFYTALGIRYTKKRGGFQAPPMEEDEPQDPPRDKGGRPKSRATGPRNESSPYTAKGIGHIQLVDKPAGGYPTVETRSPGGGAIKDFQLSKDDDAVSDISDEDLSEVIQELTKQKINERVALYDFPVADYRNTTPIDPTGPYKRNLRLTEINSFDSTKNAGLDDIGDFIGSIKTEIDTSTDGDGKLRPTGWLHVEKLVAEFAAHYSVFFALMIMKHHFGLPIALDRSKAYLPWSGPLPFSSKGIRQYMEEKNKLLDEQHQLVATNVHEPSLDMDWA